MTVGFRRFFAAFSLVTLVSVLAAAPANAATPTGVGTSGGNVSLVSVDYGAILQAAVLGESSGESIDPLVGTPSATETLAPLNVSSATLPALDALSVPSVQTTSTGSPDHVDTALVDLGSLGVPGVSGTINPASLTSLVDANGAKDALASTLANVNLLGVLGIGAANLDIGGLAGPEAATANRGASADAITVLDIQGVLNLLGLDIGDLPLQIVASLLEQLGGLPAVNALVGTAFGNAGDVVTGVGLVKAAVTTAQGQVDAAQATLNTATATLTTATTNLSNAVSALNALCNVLPPGPLRDTCFATNAGAVNAAQTAVNTAQTAVNTAQAAVDAAQATLDAVLAFLDDLLNSLIGVLSGTPVLEIENVAAGATALAAATVADSSALVTATIGDIRLGGLDLGGIDTNAALDQIESLANTVSSTVNGILTTIDPSLANLISLKLFQRSTSVAQNGDYVEALAAVTALELTITPPDVCAVVSNVLSQTPISSLTSGLTLPPSPVTGVLDQLGSIVPGCLQGLAAAPVRGFAIPDGAVAALTGPLTLKAASANSVAEFTTAAQPTLPTTTNTPTTTGTPSTAVQGPALSRTGMNETLLLVVGGLMAAVALGLRRATAQARVSSRRR